MDRKLGAPTFSSFLHVLVAFAFSLPTWAAVAYIDIACAFALGGPLFFYGKEMKEYQRRRELLGDGKHNKLKLKDLNPVVWARSGKSDAFWDFMLPVIGCVLISIPLAIYT